LWYRVNSIGGVTEKVAPSIEFTHLYLDLNGFEGWMDKKMIFNGLEAICFHNHFALTIGGKKGEFG
jgi:hypothetical protein